MHIKEHKFRSILRIMQYFVHIFSKLFKLVNVIYVHVYCVHYGCHELEGRALVLYTNLNKWLHHSGVRSWCDESSDRSFLLDPFSYFSFQPVLHDWCNKGRIMCYPVYVLSCHIKEPLLLIGKSSPRGGSGFPLSLAI